MMNPINGKILDIEHSPDKSVAFVYIKLSEKISFQAGQFVILEEENNLLKKRPYSIATPPSLMDTQGVIGFIIKKASAAGMSHYLTNIIKTGDSIKVYGPIGHMTDKHISTDYVLISTGSGLGPIYSIFHNIKFKANIRIYHIFGERDIPTIPQSVMQSFLSNTAKGKNTRIEQQIYLSRPQNLGTYSDHIKQGYVQDALQKMTKGSILPETTTAFICGKPAMVDDVRTRLIEERKIPQQRCLFEKY